jgi:hypothetical protein
VTTSQTDIKEIITYYESQWWINNDYPSEKTVLERFSIEKKHLVLIEGNINSALESRGLPPVEFSVAKIKKTDGLDPDFVLACNLLCDLNDKRTTAAKLKAIDMPTKKWQALLNDPNNRNYYERRVEKVFKNADIAAKIGLAKNVETGDLQSIKYLHELTGTYRPNQETILNLGVLLGKLMEVLSAILTPDQFVLAADRFEEVLAMPGTMRELVSGEKVA